MKNRFTQIYNSVLRSPKISAAELKVLLYLATYLEAFPSLERISRDTGIKSRTTICKAIKELEAKGLLEVLSHGYSVGGKSSSNHYVVLNTKVPPKPKKGE